MSKIISGAPSPDTSPANIAKVLRVDAADLLSHGGGGKVRASIAQHLYALADALDAQAAISWETRLSCAALAMRDATGWTEKERAAKVLFAAFPELAPTDD